MTLQQPGFENLGRDMVEQPARQMMGAAGQVLQTRIPPEKREAIAKQVQDQLRKYGDESTAIVREKTPKVSQASLAPMLEEKFSEDELRQLLAALEAPAFKKFQQIQPEMVNAFRQGLVKEIEPVIEPKLKALEQGVGAALGVPDPTASQPKGTAPKPAAPAASKPAAKK
ncbi:hypothetical protein ACVNIS_07165 [Sphaerotilaceae bacterium SBD11-9]